MTIPFIKMHGAGNDYILLDGFETAVPEALPQLAQRLSQRHTSIGSDGLIVLRPSSADNADVEMQMLNADGSTGLMCGNGVRCVALWMHLQGRVAESCRIQTASRCVVAQILTADKSAMTGTIAVDMGQPEHHADEQTLSFENDSEIGVACRQLSYTSVSMGNPHAVVFGQELTDFNVLQISDSMQTRPEFPGGVNVEWVRADSENELTIRVFERGSGETLACGSGACATVVAAALRGVCRRGQEVAVHLPGGTLKVLWQQDSSVRLTGPAAVSFQGSVSP